MRFQPVYRVTVYYYFRNRLENPKDPGSNKHSNVKKKKKIIFKYNSRNTTKVYSKYFLNIFFKNTRVTLKFDTNSN